VGSAVAVRWTPNLEAAPQAAPRGTRPDRTSAAPPVPTLADTAPPEAVLPLSKTASPVTRRPLPSPPAVPARAVGSTASVEAETRLIGEAREELRSGGRARALPPLAEHPRRYPAGALGEERDAMRVASLCSLGRVAEARAS